MSAASRTESEGLVRCFGCGSAPQGNTIHCLADGSNCPSCVARVVEAQASLLPARESITASSEHEWSDAARAEGTEDLVDVHSSDVPSLIGRMPGTERFQLLSGGGESGEARFGEVPILDPGPPEPA